MKKRVFIIHGWEGTPNSNWFPWLKNELEKKGFEVPVPQLPNTMTPTLESWLPYIREYIKDPDENTILVGHSLGCITILRYLESIDKRIKVAVLVAGFGHDLDYEGYKGEVKSFFKNPIDWDKIKSNCKKFIAIHSKDDPYVNFDNSELFRKKLDAQIIIHENMGHYNEGVGITELPEVLNVILGI